MNDNLVDEILSAKHDFEAEDAAWNFIHSLKQNFHPLLLDLLKSNFPEVVCMAANAISVSLRGDGTMELWSTICDALSRVDPNYEELNKRDRELLRQMLLEGKTMAELLR